MRMRAFPAAILCLTIAASASLGAGGPNGKGPDGNGPPGHAGDPPAPPATPDPPPPPGGPDTPLSPEGQLTIGADQNMARDAVDSGKALPLADIVALIGASLGGRVIDARLLSNGRALVYRLIVLTDGGLSRRVYVDARTGNAVPAR